MAAGDPDTVRPTDSSVRQRCGAAGDGGASSSWRTLRDGVVEQQAAGQGRQHAIVVVGERGRGKIGRVGPTIGSWYRRCDIEYAGCRRTGIKKMISMSRIEYFFGAASAHRSDGNIPHRTVHAISKTSVCNIKT